MSLPEWREHRDLSQSELAERVGIGQGTLANIEARRRLPSTKLLLRLCDELRLSAQERAEALRLYGTPTAEPTNGSEAA